MFADRLAVAATVHCLTGCAIGEITGLVIGEILGFSAAATIALAFVLAFVFGYSLSLLPLLKAGAVFAVALKTVILADTLSILTMEIVDNFVMANVPGALEAGVVNPIFWLSMSLALLLAFVAAYPVNKYLIGKNMGHALLHKQHNHDDHSQHEGHHEH